MMLALRMLDVLVETGGLSAGETLNLTESDLQVCILSHNIWYNVLYNMHIHNAYI